MTFDSSVVGWVRDPWLDFGSGFLRGCDYISVMVVIFLGISRMLVQAALIHFNSNENF